MEFSSPAKRRSDFREASKASNLLVGRKLVDDDANLCGEVKKFELAIKESS